MDEEEEATPGQIEMVQQLMEIFPDESIKRCSEMVAMSRFNLEAAVDLMCRGVSFEGGTRAGEVDGDTSRKRPAQGTANDGAFVDLCSSEENSPKKQRPAAAEEGCCRISLKVVTYNVWFQDNLAGDLRMAAIGGIIQQQNPDIVLLQEVTPYLQQALLAQPFATGFVCSPAPPSASYYTLIFVAKRVRGAFGEPMFNRRKFPHSR